MRYCFNLLYERLKGDYTIMSMIRTVKQENPFVQLDKHVLNDETISWEAKGIMAYILSKPDGWTIRKTDLIKRSKSGKTRVESALLELMAAGYLNWYQTIDEETGQFDGWVYDVYERPSFNPELEKCSSEGKKRIENRKNRNKKRNNSLFAPKVDNQPADNQPADNQPFINNNDNNNDNNNNELELKEEEEEKNNIYNIEAHNNFVYDVLKEELHDKSVSDATIDKIIKLMQSRKIENYRMEDLENQCKHMCNMIDNKQRIYDFAEYFVNGLEQMTENTIVNMQYQLDKPKIKQATYEFYNWLEDEKKI